MNLEKLLKERDALREEIKCRKNQNETTLLYIKDFLSKIDDYVSFCKQKDVYSYGWYEFDGATYYIGCDGKRFSINLCNPKAIDNLGPRYIEYKNGGICYCLVGINPTLETIVNHDGTLKEPAQWFNRNIGMILNLLEKGLENCVKKQIEDAQKMLAK